MKTRDLSIIRDAAGNSNPFSGDKNIFALKFEDGGMDIMTYMADEVMDIFGEYLDLEALYRGEVCRMPTYEVVCMNALAAAAFR